MKLVLISLSVLLLVPVALFIRDWWVMRKLKASAALKKNTLQALITKFSAGVEVTTEEIHNIASIPSLRLSLYSILQTSGRTDVFPAEFYTLEKGAESYMVEWLEFPTELGRAPDEIHWLKNVDLDLPTRIYYYVFRFRSSAPRWASKIGWMLGVCGPYDDESLPFDPPNKVFSRFNPIGFITPDEEVQWVHDHVNN